jgi:hypothetical protein
MSTPHQFTTSHLVGTFRVHETDAGWFVIAKLDDGFRSNSWQAVEGPYPSEDEAETRVRWYRKQAR